MDLNELQSVRSRERQTAELQQLRESFYEEVGDYIDQLERERERVAERTDDPFSDPQVQRLTDDIDTAKGTVESLYERRIGKLVKQASLEAAGMGAETDGLTREERDAFESIVAAIESNRERVLDGVVAGDPVEEPPEGAASPGLPAAASESAPDRRGGDARAVHDTTGAGAGAGAGGGGGESPAEGDGRDPDSQHPSDSGTAGDTPAGGVDEAPPIDAADLMGDGPPAPNDGAGPSHGGVQTGAEADPTPAPDSDPTAETGTGTETGTEAIERRPEPDDDSRTDPPGVAPSTSTDGGPGIGARATDPTGGTDPGPDADGFAPAEEGQDDSPDSDHATVRVTADVGEILGVDGRTYRLAAADVVRLPAANAEALIEREAAEPLDDPGPLGDDPPESASNRPASSEPS